MSTIGNDLRKTSEPIVVRLNRGVMFAGFAFALLFGSTPFALPLSAPLQAEAPPANSEQESPLAPEDSGPGPVKAPANSAENAVEPEAAKAGESTEPAAGASKGFLWSVKSKTTTVYLLGSIHVADDSLYPLRDTILKAFAESSVLALEIDPDKVDKTVLPAAVFEKGMYRDKAKSLKAVLSPELYARLVEEMKKIKTDLTGVERMRPWLVRMMIAQTRLAQAGYRASRGIDYYFHKAARGRSMPIEELEDAQMQLQALADSPESEQILMLARLLEDPDADASMRPMLRAWREGDAGYIDTEIVGDMRDDPALQATFRALFTDRNVGMADRVEEYLRGDRTIFVVVGAGHLIGAESVIALLRARGHTIERL